MHSIQQWLESIGWGDWSITVASADASFRSYYRLSRVGTLAHHKPVLNFGGKECPPYSETYIVMDSSLAKESLPSFVEMNKRLSDVHVRVPRIIVKNIKLGYLILEDFGNTHYLDVLNEENYQKLYKQAIDEIIKIQHSDTKGLPLYDKEFLHFEMDLMQEWYLEKYLNMTLADDDKNTICMALENIANVVLEQPQGVFVHRDYHARNIMLTPKDEVGIIDFQDARAGAVTYDLVSLLKDCYIEWDKEEVVKLALYYRDAAGLDADDTTFIKWFDFMGLQRHIKVLGIFARLHLRDGKSGYLKDIPLTLKYVVDAASKYPELSGLATLLKTA